MKYKYELTIENKCFGNHVALMVAASLQCFFLPSLCVPDLSNTSKSYLSNINQH